ncbi:hypothetical protein ABVT39_018508 [Epinephelus coioides]
MEYIDQILTLSKSIFWTVTEVKSNKKRCRRLAERVKALEEPVVSIRQRGPGQITPAVNRALWKLCMTLSTAQELVRKCTKNNFLNALKCKGKFNSVNESLIDTFQVLSRALHVDQGSVMRRVFQEDDDDDSDDGLVLFGSMAPMPYSRPMAPARYPAAAAPSPFFAAQMPQPVTLVHAAVMGVEDDTVFYAEGVFLAQ